MIWQLGCIEGPLMGFSQKISWERLMSPPHPWVVLTQNGEIGAPFHTGRAAVGVQFLVWHLSFTCSLLYKERRGEFRVRWWDLELSFEDPWEALIFSTSSYIKSLFTYLKAHWRIRSSRCLALPRGSWKRPPLQQFRKSYHYLTFTFPLSSSFSHSFLENCLELNCYCLIFASLYFYRCFDASLTPKTLPIDRPEFVLEVKLV